MYWVCFFEWERCPELLWCTIPYLLYSMSLIIDFQLSSPSIPTTYPTIIIITITPADFDTSCFTGKYVTGEEIGNKYFQNLFLNRNESAKSLLRVSSGGGSTSVNDLRAASVGCESMHNDNREPEDGQKGCEAI